MQRISVIGTTGSGKTTVAKRTAKALGVPHIELDALHWEPDWEEVSTEVFRERVSDAIRGDRWVVDGNYSKVRDIVWVRADTVLWLDYPFHIIFMRLLWRTLRRLILRDKLWNDNRESLTMILSRDSILLWAITSHPRYRREYAQLMSDPEYSYIRFLRHKTPTETEQWLNSLKP